MPHRRHLRYWANPPLLDLCFPTLPSENSRTRMGAGRAPAATARHPCTSVENGCIDDRCDGGYTGRMRCLPVLAMLAVLGAPVTPGAAVADDVPASPDEGGPRAWRVHARSMINLREDASSGSRAIAQLPPSTVLQNLGCKRTAGRTWCDVQKLTGGPRGWVALELLRPAVGPDGTVPRGPDDSARRAGERKFDATGSLPCASRAGQPTAPCTFGVARAGGGYATVVVTRPDGRTRAIFFALGNPFGTDSSQADGYGELTFRRESDLLLVGVGDERYEIPDAVILGG